MGGQKPRVGLGEIQEGRGRREPWGDSVLAWVMRWVWVLSSERGAQAGEGTDAE